MTADAAAFRATFPEFNDGDYPDPAITGWITQAKALHDVSGWATLFLAAHLITIARADGAGIHELDGGDGEVSEETIGPKRVMYVTQAKKDGESFYTRSSYGRRFLELERRAAGRVMSARVYG